MKAASFIKEVRQETAKVKWPEPKEVLVATLFVLVAAGLAGLFFLLVDSAIYKLIKLFLGIGV